MAAIGREASPKKSLSLRSRRKHKAWGASPRIRTQKGKSGARETGDSVKCEVFRPLSRALAHFFGSINLGLAPQALCFRLLRRLRSIIQFRLLVQSPSVMRN